MSKTNVPRLCITKELTPFYSNKKRFTYSCAQDILSYYPFLCVMGKNMMIFIPSGQSLKLSFKENSCSHFL